MLAFKAEKTKCALHATLSLQLVSFFSSLKMHINIFTVFDTYRKIYDSHVLLVNDIFSTAKLVINQGKVIK